MRRIVIVGIVIGLGLFVQGCGDAGIQGLGHVPAFGQYDACVRMIDAWESRAAECGRMSDPKGFEGYRAKCEQALGVNVDEGAEGCLQAVKGEECTKIDRLPEACWGYRFL